MIFNSCSDALSLGSARNGTKFATENRRSLSASVLQRSALELVVMHKLIYILFVKQNYSYILAPWRCLGKSYFAKSKAGT